MNRIFIGAVLCAIGAASLSAQTRTLTDKNCHVTIPADWKQLGPHSAESPGAKGMAAIVRSIPANQYKMMLGMIKNGQMASLNPKVLDENAKRVLIQTEAKANGKTTTHYQVMTKASPGCQGSADFSDPSEAAAARKIVESTTGAQ